MKMLHVLDFDPFVGFCRFQRYLIWHFIALHHGKNKARIKSVLKKHSFQFQHHVALHFSLNWSIKQTNMWSSAIKPPGWQYAGYFCCWALPSLKEDEIKTAFILFFDILPACSNTLLCPSVTVAGEEWLSKLSYKVPEKICCQRSEHRDTPLTSRPGCAQRTGTIVIA